MEPEHLLAALLAQDGGVVPQVFLKMNINPTTLLAEAEAEVDKLPRLSSPGAPASPAGRRACSSAPRRRRGN